MDKVQKHNSFNSKYNAYITILLSVSLMTYNELLCSWVDTIGLQRYVQYMIIN